MNTCCSLNCPFIAICRNYNFLVDRGHECKTYRKILSISKKELMKLKEDITNE